MQGEWVTSLFRLQHFDGTKFEEMMTLEGPKSTQDIS